jgi:hypothetical protein
MNTQEQPNGSHVYLIEQAPEHIQALIKVDNQLSYGKYVVWVGDLEIGIQYDIGLTPEGAIEYFYDNTSLHKLPYYQEWIPNKTLGETSIGVYYEQEGLRDNEPFYGLTYDLEHKAVVEFPEAPITLLQLNGLVQALNTLSDDVLTEGVELLHMELGTPPLQRLGHKKYLVLDVETDDVVKDLFT